jgi:hypothetical protein
MMDIINFASHYETLLQNGNFLLMFKLNLIVASDFFFFRLKRSEIAYFVDKICISSKINEIYQNKRVLNRFSKTFLYICFAKK